MSFAHGNSQLPKLQLLQKPPVFLLPSVYIFGKNPEDTVQEARTCQKFYLQRRKNRPQNINDKREIEAGLLQFISSVSSNHESLKLPFQFIPHWLHPF